jgi:hypothetical protein
LESVVHWLEYFTGNFLVTLPVFLIGETIFFYENYLFYTEHWKSFLSTFELEKNYVNFY